MIRLRRTASLSVGWECEPCDIIFVGVTALNMRNNRLLKMSAKLFEPVDVASLVFFRVTFGLMMLWNVFYYWPRIARHYIIPKFHFKYYGFHWVRVLPGDGMYYVFVLLGILALLIVLGLFHWYYLYFPARSDIPLKSHVFGLSYQFPLDLHPLPSVLFLGCVNKSQETVSICSCLVSLALTRSNRPGLFLRGTRQVEP